MQDAPNPQAGAVSHLKSAGGPDSVPGHLTSASSQTRDTGMEQLGLSHNAGLPLPWLPGCRGGDAAAAMWEAQGSGGSSRGWGPSEGTLGSAWRKVQLSPPPSSIPLLLSFAFIPLPVCFSQLLPWGAGLGVGGGCLTLQGSRARAAASAPTHEWGGWREDGKGGS